MLLSVSSSSSSKSMTGTGAGGVSSTPRVATYSGRTVRRRWPLGSMFLDGMGDQLSGLQEKDKGGEGEGEGVSGVLAAGELAEEDHGQDSGRDGCIERDGMEADGAWGDGDAP